MLSLPAFLEVTFVSGCLHLLEHLAELEEVGGPAVGLLLLLTLGAPGQHLHWGSPSSQGLQSRMKYQ